MKTIVECRTLARMDVRDVCVKNGFYTYGTNDEYNEMFHLWEREVDSAKLHEIAMDIWLHSDKKRLEAEGWNVVAIMNALASVSRFTYDEVDVNDLPKDMAIPLTVVKKTIYKYFTPYLGDELLHEMLKEEK